MTETPTARTRWSTQVGEATMDRARAAVAAIVRDQPGYSFAKLLADALLARANSDPTTWSPGGRSPWVRISAFIPSDVAHAAREAVLDGGVTLSAFTDAALDAHLTELEAVHHGGAPWPRVGQLRRGARMKDT